MPGECEAGRNGVGRLETVLPGNQRDTWYCMRASQQDMRVYIGNELRKEYTTKDTRMVGNNSASAYVFFEVVREDSGKILRIELVSDSEYSGFLNGVYTGDKNDIVDFFIRQCFVVIVVSMYMLTMSSLAVVTGIILGVIYKRKIEITYLGLGVFVLSLAMTVESNIRQFFLPNISVASHVGFLLTILVPYPFLVYVRLTKRPL